MARKTKLKTKSYTSSTVRENRRQIMPPTSQLTTSFIANQQPLAFLSQQPLQLFGKQLFHVSMDNLLYSPNQKNQNP
jgi:hypothetical protein